MHSLRRQRGAAALFAALGLIGMLMAAGFALDLAQLHLAKRELQNMASLGALDTARAAGGCLAPDQDRQSTANRSALDSIRRLNGEPQWLKSGKVTLGRYALGAGNSRVFQAVPDEEAAGAWAFQIELERPLPRRLLPMPNVDSSARLRARAAAAMAPVASFSVGSFLLTIRPTDRRMLNDLFNAILPEPVNLDVASYQGLIDTSVTLDGLAEELGIPGDELPTQPVSLPGLLRGIAATLFEAGETVAGAAVETLADAAPDEVVVVGDALGLPEDAAVGVSAVAVGTMDLTRALIMNSATPIFTLTPDVEIPGVGGVQAQVRLGQGSTTALGPATQDGLRQYLTRAENTQGVVDLALGLLPGLGMPVNLNLRAVLADADAELHEIRCANRTRAQHQVEIGVQTSVSQLVVDNGPENPLLRLPLPLVPGVEDTAICWQGAVEMGDARNVPLNFTGPFDPDDPEVLAKNTQTVGSDLALALEHAIDDLLARSPPFVCGPVGALIDPVVQPVLATLTGFLGPTLAAAGEQLVQPMLQSIGVNLGGADVLVREVRVRPPALIVSE